MKKKRKIDFLKLGITLFGISILFYNCQGDKIQYDEIKQKPELSTVSKSLAKNIFEHYFIPKENNLKNTYNKQKNTLKIKPNWSTFNQESLEFTDALLSKVSIKTNAITNLSSKIIFITINDKVLRVIETTSFINNDKHKVYFHNLSGDFIVGFKLSKDVVVKKLVSSRKVNKANVFSFIYLFQNDCDEDLVAESTFCDNELDEIFLEINPKHSNASIFQSLMLATDIGYMTNGGSGSMGLFGDDDSNSGDNDTNQCSGGKVFNVSTQSCECPSGTKENSQGKCIPDPCGSLKNLTKTNQTSLNIKPIVNSLYNKTSLNKEWSVSFKKRMIAGELHNQPQQNGIQEGPSISRSVFNSGNTWYGQAHTHPKGTYTIFSWLDVKALRELYTSVNENFKNDVFLMVIAHDGIVYSLKVNDISALMKELDADWSIAEGNTKEEKEKDIEEQITERYRNSTNLEETFLKKFKNYGISLYKTTHTDIENWKNLYLDTNNNLQAKPCN